MLREELGRLAHLSCPEIKGRLVKRAFGLFCGLRQYLGRENTGKPNCEC